MTAQHFMQNPGEDPVDISGHVLLPGIGEDGFAVQTQAESGSVAGSTVLFDDPEGTFYPIGLNAYRVYETDSEADDPLLFSGGFQARRERRGTYRTGGSRKVEATIEDGNAGLSRFVVRAGEGGNRPEETEEERMEWLFTTSGMALHWDFATSILDLGGTVLQATDFTDMTLQQVLDDMAQRTGKNYYVFWDGSVGNPPEALLVYAHDSGSHLSSDLRFSNVETDHDGDTTFYAGLDWELSIDPARIASYVALRYANGRVDEEDSATADEFSRIDRVMDGAYIKTAGAATARALQYLNELDDEEMIVSGTVYLPASKASQFRAGMRVQMKATHLTGLSDFSWVRLVNVTITQIATDEQVVAYALAFEGTFTPGVSCSAILASLEAQTSGAITGMPPYGSPVVAGDLPGIAVAYIAVGNNGIFLTGEEGLQVDAPWTALPGLPGGDDPHTETDLAYQENGAGTPEFTFIEGTGPGVADGRQIGVWIPNGSFVQASNGSVGSVCTWPTPLTAGNIVILGRTAEGPSGFDTDPTHGEVDMIVIDEITGALENANSVVGLWACCVAEDGEDIDHSSSASSFWTHAIEVSLS